MGKMNAEEKTFGVTTLKRLIEARDLTQTQLSQLSEVPQPQISKIISGQVQPTDEVLHKLFEALGLKLNDVLEKGTTSDELVGYLATPLTGLDDQAERERDRVVAQIRDIASLEEFTNPSFRFYWPGDFTHPTKNTDFTSGQVYLTDRSRASAYDFILLLCASPSFGVGQENEIATQAGLPAIRLIPKGLSRMMLGSFIRATDVSYGGDLRAGISLDRDRLVEALRGVRKTYFRHRALYRGINGHDFGRRLEVLVNERQGNYEACAEDLGISLGYLHSLMHEPLIVSNPSARLLQRISRLLSVSIGFLLGETTDSDPVATESRATWHTWIEGAPSVEAVIADRLWREWEEEDRHSRREPQLASMRSPSRTAMKQADWDRRYQEAKRNAPTRPSKKQNDLFGS